MAGKQNLEYNRMQPPFFFGYGSLVNRATHDYPDAKPARLVGWCRAWVHTVARPVAYLSVIRDPHRTIDGLVAEVPGGDWGALDLREHAYSRHLVTADLHDVPPVQAAVYAVPLDASQPPQATHPILLSYLDVVVQGFLREFGPKGALDFFATTTGWDAPILNDRAAPLYPRAQILTPAEISVVDTALRKMDAKIMETGGS
jgi:hypothetical protein